MRFLPLILLLLCACGDEKSPQFVEIFDPTRVDGEPCAINLDCKGGACLGEVSGWPGGMCTTLNCEDGCNGDSRACLPLLGETTACLVRCETLEDCRDGYTCSALAGEKVCQPQLVDGPAQGRVGSSCASDGDCNSGLVCDTAQPGGYCVYPDCDNCGEDGVCVDDSCGQQCTETRDCRVGYVCRPQAEGSACVAAASVVSPVPFETTREVLGVTCNARSVGEVDGRKRWELDFTVPDKPGFVVVPFVATGIVEPFKILGPNGLVIDLVDTYRHQNIRATEVDGLDIVPEGLFKTVSFDWPLQVPYAPQFANYVVPGATYTMWVETDEATPCVYVLGAEEGTVLDLNIYLVGLGDLDASSAPDDPGVKAVMARFGELYAQVGIKLGKVRFLDVDEETAERYRIVRGFPDIRRLTALSPPPGPTLDDHLSVNLFWVVDIIVGNAAGLLLGVSAGVPGAPGMHGNANNGLVFRVADLGVANDYVAHIMAHEVGHYLGLRHTTEVLNGTGTQEAADYDALVGVVDPIEDTPVCENIFRLTTSCPDYGNLMFPAAPDAAVAREYGELSDQQGQMLRLNPLVKPDTLTP